MLIDFKTLESFPPFVVAALARKGRRSPTMQEIAATSGLPLRTVARISSLFSWRDVNFGNIELFCRGCAFDLKSIRKQAQYLRGTASAQHKFSHLSTARRHSFEKRLVEWQKLQAK